MRISTIVSPTLLIAFVSACEPAPPWTVSEQGFGPVRLGMKVEEAEALLGVKLHQDDYNDDDVCRHFAPASGFPGLAFMTSHRAIVRVDIIEGTIATDKSAKVGDTEQHVLEVYTGRIKAGPHFYTGPEGHYLRVTDVDGKVRMVFETD